MNILKKNKFFKNFLLPAGLLLLIAGAVVFLIWWLQPDSYENYGNMYHQISNYNTPHQYTPQSSGYYDNSYNNDLPYNQYGYSRGNYDSNRNMFKRKSYSRSYYDN